LLARLDDWLAQNPSASQPALPAVSAQAQTAVVKNPGDAADDPAIWLHPKQPQQSLVLGTDKRRGLAVYDLQGRERQFLAVGRINNVDLRQGLKYGGKPIDLAVATQRDEAGLVLFEVQPTGRVRELARLPTSLNDIYGICVGRNGAGQLDIFPNDKDGRVQQIRLHRDSGRWRAERLREFKLASQPEGCVVDEARQQLFVGEEKLGIWRISLAGDGPLSPELAVPAGGALVPDVEGLALFQGNALHNKRYLLVSSQGNDSFVLYDADAPHALRGAFRIGINSGLRIDAVSETDGIELSAANFGGPYRDGLLVVQDGHKRLPQGTQNFKLVPWKAVLQKLGLLR
jgi:3-phytase